MGIHEFRVWRGVMDSSTVYNRYASGFVTTQFPTPEPTSPSPQPTPLPTLSPTPQPTLSPSSHAPTVPSYSIGTVAGNFVCERPVNPRKMTFGKCLPVESLLSNITLPSVTLTYTDMTPNDIFPSAYENVTIGLAVLHMYNYNGLDVVYPVIGDGQMHSPLKIHVNSMTGSPYISLSYYYRSTHQYKNAYQQIMLQLGDNEIQIPKFDDNLYLQYQFLLAYNDSLVLDSFIVQDIQLINQFSTTGSSTFMPSAKPTVSPAPTISDVFGDFPPVHGGNVGVPDHHYSSEPTFSPTSVPSTVPSSSSPSVSFSPSSSPSSSSPSSVPSSSSPSS